MKDSSGKNGIMKNVVWKLAETILTQLVTFIVSVALARILSPDDYGAVAMITVFITIANVFVVSGIPTALIQKKDADEKDFSSVFFFNLALSLSLYAMLFFAAPWVARLYKTPILVDTLRVLGISVIISAFNSVQSAYVSKQMLFKRYFWSTLIGTVLSGVIGIRMAYAGYGIWALVFQRIVNITVAALVLLFTVKWHPILYFSWNRLKSLLKFGWKILFEGLSETLSNELSNMVIGKVYTSSDLGFYSKGGQIPGLVANNLSSPINSVLFPAICLEQDNDERVKELLRKAVKTSTYVTFPLLVGLAAVAKPLIQILLTDKWIETIPYLRIFCLIYAANCFLIPRHQALNGIGRSDVYMYEHMAVRVIKIGILFCVYRVSVMAIAVGGIIPSILMVLTVMFTSKKYNGYDYWEQIIDVLPTIGVCLCMGFLVYFIGMLPLSDLPMLILQVGAGGVLYISMGWFFKMSVFVNLKDYLFSILCWKNSRK